MEVSAILREPHAIDWSRLLGSDKADRKSKRGFLLRVAIGGAMLSLFFITTVAAFGVLLLIWSIGPSGEGIAGIITCIVVESFIVRLACGFAAQAMSEFKLANKYRAQKLAREIQKDERAPVLLLRAFSDDDTSLTRPSNSFSLTDDEGREIFGKKNSFEEMIVRLFRRVGPTIAIGRPGEELPPIGAARFWIRHDRWQSAVDHLLDQCQFVIMILGDAQGENGLVWEVRRIFSLKDPTKIVLFAPPLPEREVKKRWDRYVEISNGRLTPFRGGELAATFSEDWSCHVARDVTPEGFMARSMLRYHLLVRVR